jgi:hypothetical protein
MKKFLALSVLVYGLLFGSWMAFAQLTLTGAGKGLQAPVGYQGPGDVVSGATAWWGLRAYSNATAGTNAIDVAGVNTSTTFTFVTKAADGTLELSAGGAAAFITANSGANNMLISKLYDQTGNGHHATAAGAQRVPFVLSGIGSLSVMTFNSSTQQLNVTGFNLAQPFSMVSAAKPTSVAALQSLMDDSSSVFLLINTTPVLRMDDNSITLLGSAVSSGTWFVMQGVYSGASSVATVNSTDTTGTVGTVGLSNGNTLTIGNDGFNLAFTGSMGENGIWPIGFSSGQRSSIASNIRTFWGF